jgi:putative thg1
METTKLLMENWQASIGYTQSDEITLIFKIERKQFDGKIQKLVSLIAAQTSVLFNKILADKLNENKETNEVRLDVLNNIFPLLPIFDCRVIELDDEKNVVDVLNWRFQDGVK